MLRELLEFIRSVFKHWVVLMGTAAFTFIGIYAAATSQGNEWIARVSLSAAGLMILVATFLAWREKSNRLSVVSAELSVIKAELQEERSVKSAPQLILHYEDGAFGRILVVENVSHGKHACNIRLISFTLRGFMVKADPIQYLESGARHALVVYLERNNETYSYDVKEPVGGWEQSDPFKVETPISLEYTDPVGTTTYVAEFLWICDRLLDPVIEARGVATKAIKRILPTVGIVLAVVAGAANQTVT